MNWSVAGDVVRTVAAVGAITGGIIALLQFRRANRTRRAEWLASLHEQFFERGRYSRVRRALDYRADPDYSTLKAAVGGEAPHEIADELYRYLNFFEFMAGLGQLGQVSRREIQILFDYDLGMLRQHGFVMALLEPQGFEQLHELLGSLESGRSSR
jgi:hypothetical protein